MSLTSTYKGKSGVEVIFEYYDADSWTMLELRYGSVVEVFIYPRLHII